MIFKDSFFSYNLLILIKSKSVNFTYTIKIAVFFGKAVIFFDDTINIRKTLCWTEFTEKFVFILPNYNLNGAIGCVFKDKQFKIYQAKVFNKVENQDSIGTLKIEGKNRLLVKCSDGYLELLSIQLEGKQRMDVKSFLNGINKDDLVKEKLC